MTTVGLFLLAGALALGLGLLVPVPSSVLAMLAGVALQLVGAPLDEGLVRDGLLLAGTFLVFLVGAEIDRRDLVPSAARGTVLAGAHLVASALLAVLLWAILPLDRWSAAYFGLILAAGSTIVVLDLLRSRERFFEPVGRLTAATVIVQDLAVILGLTVIGASSGSGVALGLAAAVTAALAAAAWLCGRWLAPMVLLGRRVDEEERLLFIVALLFVFAGVCYWAEVPVVLGAYFAGMAVSRFPAGGVVRGYTTTLSDFFTVAFFVLLGAAVAVPRLTGTLVLVEALLVVGVLVVRPLLLLPVVRRMGLTVRSSIETLMLGAQCGELALVVAVVGLQQGHIDEGILGVTALLVVITMSLTPWLSSDRVVLRLTHRYPLRRRLHAHEPPRDHVVLLGCGEGGRMLLAELRAAHAKVVVVDDDPAVVAALDAEGITVIRGDGGEPEVLRAAGALAARAVVSTMTRLDDNRRLLEALPGQRVYVRVFSEADGEQIRAAGGVPVVEAEVAAAAFFRWYERRMPPPSR